MKNYYKYVAAIGFILYLVRLLIYGTSVKDTSVLQEMMIVFSFAFMFWGIIGDIAENLTIQKIYKSDNMTINTTNTTVEHKTTETRIEDATP